MPTKSKVKSVHKKSKSQLKNKSKSKSKISDAKIKVWLNSEIKEISNNPEKYGFIGLQDPQIYMQGNKLMMWSIEEDECPEQYYITSGKYPNKLSVKHIKTDNIKKYVKEKYPNYKKNSKFNQVVIDAYLLPRSHSNYVS